MKIAYCGYDFFSGVLDALLNDGHELVELFTWPTDNEYDFNQQVFALAAKCKARVSISPINLEDLARLKTKGVELIVSAAYPHHIPDWRDSCRFAINIHPSELPIGRGPWPLPWTILKKLKTSAVTVHEVSPGWDAGDILAQEVFEVSESETLVSLSVKAQLVAKLVVPRVVREIESLWRMKIPQSPTGIYWAMPKREDRTITWDKTVDEIDCICRAFKKFEPFVFLGDKRYFVRQHDCWKAGHNLTPGTLVHQYNGTVVYAATDGFVALTDLFKAY